MMWSRREVGLGLLGGLGAAAGAAGGAWADPDPGLTDKGPADAPGVAGFALTRNHIWTGVMLDGHGPYPFLIDTGATWYMVDPALAQQIGLKLTGDRDMQHTNGGRLLLPIYQLEHILIGGGTYDLNTVIVGLREDRNDITNGMVPLSSGDVTTLNFDTRKLVATGAMGSMPDGYESLDLLNTHGHPGLAALVGAPGASRGGRGPTQIVEDASHMARVLLTRQPIVEVRLDGQPVRLMVDSGEQGGLYLFPDYVRRHGLWTHYPKYLEAVDQTIGGRVKTRIVRPDQLAFGRHVFQRPVVTLADPASRGDLFDLADGVIGVETIRRLNFIHNPRNFVMGFKPSGMFNDIWRYDRAGLSIDRVDKAIQIIDVAEGGPAWKSGLRKGDVVTGWAGAEQVKDSGPYFSLLWALQGEPGSQLGIQIANGDGDKPQVVGVTLEERI